MGRAAVGRLSVNGERVVDGSSNAGAAQVAAYSLTIWGAHNIEMVDMVTIAAFQRLYQGGGQQSGITIGHLSPHAIPGIQISEFDTQDGGLHLIQTTVHPRHL